MAQGQHNPLKQGSVTEDAVATSGRRRSVLFLAVPLTGAAIGAAAGLVSGLMVDKPEKDKEEAYQRGYEAGQQSHKVSLLQLVVTVYRPIVLFPARFIADYLDATVFAPTD